MTPSTTGPLEDALRKKRQQDSVADSLGMKTPGNPAASPEPDGIAAKPKTVLINGIPHLDLPDQKHPGPAGMMADGIAGTIGYIASAPFNRDSRLEANRTGLDTSAEIEAEKKKQATKPVTPIAAMPMGVQAAANAVIADLQGRQAGYMIDNNLRSFEDKGNGIVRQVGADGKAAFTNAGTADLTDPTKKVQVNGYNGAADNEAMAKANAVRQQLIDRQPMGGIAVLADPNEAANAEKTARWRQDDLLQMARGGNRAAGEVAQETARGQNQMAAEAIRGGTQLAAEQGRNAVTMRGQDITAQTEAKRIAGNPLDNQIKENQANAGRMSNDAVKQLQDLQASYKNETDPNKQRAIAEQIRVLSGKGGADRFIPVPGGEEIGPDGMTKIRRPSSIFDTGSRQFISSEQGQTGAFGADKIKADMQAGKISRDEAIKQLKAMGYQ